MDGSNYSDVFVSWAEVDYESLHTQLAMNCTLIAVVVILYLNLSYQVFKFLI